MPLVGKRQLLRAGLMLIVLGIILPGCSLLVPTSDAPEPDTEPQRPPAPVAVPDSRDTVAEPAPQPVIDEPEPGPAVYKVAIVLSSRVPAYEDVAVALGKLLDDAEIYDLSDKSLTQKDAFDAIHNNGAEVVVAIGLRAAIFARSITALPVVFSQVFNVTEISQGRDNFKGVAAIPPLSLQLEAWRQINPELRNIGAILGEGHDSLVAEARQAADRNGMRLHYRLAKSDRETMYLFTRLATDIEGFWLFPDNRILSSSILRQLLAYAARHGVQVAVFNDSLLTLGAAISTTSVRDDIAQTVVSVINTITSGGIADVPGMTPLSRIDVRTKAARPRPVAGDATERSGEAH